MKKVRVVRVINVKSAGAPWPKQILTGLYDVREEPSIFRPAIFYHLVRGELSYGPFNGTTWQGFFDDGYLENASVVKTIGPNRRPKRKLEVV